MAIIEAIFDFIIFILKEIFGVYFLIISGYPFIGFIALVVTGGLIASWIKWGHNRKPKWTLYFILSLVVLSAIGTQVVGLIIGK